MPIIYSATASIGGETATDSTLTTGSGIKDPSAFVPILDAIPRGYVPTIGPRFYVRTFPSVPTLSVPIIPFVPSHEVPTLPVVPRSYDPA
jgi:hypothetical protein